jgi:hypothetical protein
MRHIKQFLRESLDERILHHIRKKFLNYRTDDIKVIDIIQAINGDIVFEIVPKTNPIKNNSFLPGHINILKKQIEDLYGVRVRYKLNVEDILNKLQDLIGVEFPCYGFLCRIIQIYWHHTCFMVKYEPVRPQQGNKWEELRDEIQRRTGFDAYMTRS